MTAEMGHEHQYGYIHSKDDYLKRLRRIEGQARGLAADGRGGEVLHRHPHAGLRDDQGAAVGRARPARRAHGHCVVDAAREGGREAEAKVKEASDAIARLVRS